MQTPIRILLITAVILPLALAATSLPTPIQPDPTFQTGIYTVLSSALTNSGTYTVTFTYSMGSANADVCTGIYSMDYNQKQKRHGFRTKIGSATATKLNLFVQVSNSNQPLNMLKISYLVSKSPYFDINYAQLTFAGNDVLFDSSQSALFSCFLECRQLTTTHTYTAKANPRSGVLALSSYYVNDIQGITAGNDTTEPYIGIDLNANWKATSVDVKITVYGGAQVYFVSFFYIVIEPNVIYDVNHRRAVYGRQAVGCTYHSNGCGGNYPSDTQYKTNPFYLVVDDPYRQQMVFYALDRLIVKWDGTDDYRVAFQSGPISRSNTDLIVAVDFTGNIDSYFTLAFSYLSIQNYYCPDVAPIRYYSYNWYRCTDDCGIGLYPDANRYCQLCHQTCYTCIQGTANDCTGCHNSQNRVLSGGICICDVPGGFYDDGSSLVCPGCHYTCQSCSGAAAGQCLSCQSSQNRVLNVNTCPCVNGFYDNNAATCLACHYTCSTGTCNASGSNRCLSCNSTMHREITGSFTCVCSAGWYDDSTNSELCKACHYSCKTCSGTNTNCLSCQNTYMRNHDTGTNTCPCGLGYFDNGVALCQLCHVTCFACNGPLNNNCLSCKSFSTRTLNGSVCQCPSGQFDSSDVCTNCHYSCLTCTVTASTCTSCSSTNHRTLLNSTCICSSGYFQSFTALCSTCSPGCLTCSVISTNCTGCHNQTGRYLAGGLCLCVAGYVDVLGNGTCSACHYSCAQCGGLGASGCTVCPSGRTLTSGQCLCPAVGFYDNGINVTCQPCASTCVSCSSGLSTSCTDCDPLHLRTLTPSPLGSCSCNPGLFDNGPALICQSCSSLCLTCTNTASNCTSCDTPTTFRVITSAYTCACPTGYFQSGSMAVCQLCSSACLNCSVLPTNCTACPPLRTLTGNTCPCASNTYLDGLGTCQACSYTCQTCSGSALTCTSCYSGTHRTQLGSTCPCDTGFYDNATVHCQPCSYTCLTCTSSTTCVDCPSGSYRTKQVNGSCTCNLGYYDDGANAVCLLCSGKCMSCVHYSQCLSCDSALNRQLNTSTLSCQCVALHYDNGVTLACQPCHYSCLTCSGSLSTACLTCPSTRILTAPNSCLCAAGHYESPSLTCIPCSISCLSCSVSPSNCTACHSGSYLNNYQCLCTNGYYLNGITCSACANVCLTCNGSSTACTACKPAHGTVLIGSSCVCASQKYMDTNGVCQNCHGICLECSGPTQSECLSCKSGLFRTHNSATSTCPCDGGYYDDGSLVCKPCSSPCSTCHSGSTLNCSSCISTHQLIGSSCIKLLTCPSGYFYSGFCLASCPSTTYPSASYCLPCTNNCLTCISVTVCLTCVSPYYLWADGSCQGSCSDGSYQSGRVCKDCPVGCGKCAYRSQQGTVVCSSCLSGYYTDGYLCKANGNCPALTHVIHQNHCLACLHPCLTCTSLSTSSCLSCQSNYILTSNQCLSHCPQGFYLLDNLCQPCQSTCLSCSSGQCQKCISGYYLNPASQCIPELYYMDASGQLVECHKNCLTCTDGSFSSCIACGQYRGDHGQMAVSGYCQCWRGTVDMGNGTCDSQFYKMIEQSTEGLVATSAAVSYGSALIGVISLNMFGAAFLLFYQQQYGNLYFLNASAVGQTDLVLQQYSTCSLNRYLKEGKKQETQSNQYTEQDYGRRLEYFNNVQTMESLFMRDNGWEYLSDWGMPVLVLLVGLWALCFVLWCCSDKVIGKSMHSSSLKCAAVILKKVLSFIRESSLIVAHLLTINQIALYGTASFKIILSSQNTLNYFKLGLSGLFLAYYPLYVLRLLIAAAKFGDTPQENSKFKIMMACFQTSRKRSALSRMYLPLLMLRSLCISVFLVLLSFSPNLQIISILAVFFVWCLYSICFCPYYFYLRVFIRIYQLTFLLQLIVITVSTIRPEYSRMQPAIGLMVLNYMQLGNMLGLSIAIFFATFYQFKCLTRTDSTVANTSGEVVNRQQQNSIQNIQNNISVLKLHETVENMLEDQTTFHKQFQGTMKHLEAQENYKRFIKSVIAGEQWSEKDDSTAKYRIADEERAQEESIGTTAICNQPEMEESLGNRTNEGNTAQLQRKRYRVRRKHKKADPWAEN